MSTDGLIIAASIPTRYHSTACNSSEFHDSVSHGRIFRKKRKDTRIYRECTCAYYTTDISCDPRTFEQWRIATAGAPMNKDQNVCTAIVPSLIAKSTVKCDYGLSQITIERWNFSHRLSNNFSTCLSQIIRENKFHSKFRF